MAANDLLVDLSVLQVPAFFKDPLYQGEITFGTDARLSRPPAVKGCLLLSSEGMKRSLPLHRVHFYQLTLCLAGTSSTTLSLTDYPLHKNVVYFSYPGQTNVVRDVDPALVTHSIFFTQDFYLTGKQPLMMLYQFPFLRYDGVSAFELTEGQAAAVGAQLEHLHQVYTGDYALREEVVRIGISLMLHTANQRYAELNLPRQENAPAGVVLTNRFIYLICQNHLASRRVGDYADLLAVTANHLNETVKHTTGKTCSELIKTMMILETKIMLRQTDKSIGEIADAFNFQDLSHFTKYFKKYVGLTPVEFRKQG